MQAKFVLAICGLLIGGYASADIYRWVDANGVVHYSDTPVDGAERIAIDSNATNPELVAARAAEAQGQREAAAARRDEQAAADQERQAKEEQIEAQREASCRKARAALENYNTNRRFYRPLDNGERDWLSEEEVAEAKEAAQESAEKYCN